MHSKIKLPPGFLMVLFTCNALWMSAADPLWLRYPVISPDGSEIVFSYMGDLYKVSSDGGRAVQLTTHPARDYKPVWSRDGKQIAFASNRYGNFDVHIISSEGGIPKRLTFHSADDEPGDFTPDSRSVYFTSARLDHYRSSIYPTGAQPELYRISTSGGRPEQVLTTPVGNMAMAEDGNHFLFEDIKAYEDPFRKHHTSSHARDIWHCIPGELKFEKLTEFKGEDRDPVFAPYPGFYYYISEREGSFNVYKSSLESPGDITKITSFERHPVRSLSISASGTLCFGYHGEIYTLREGKEPGRVEVQVYTDQIVNQSRNLPVTGEITEMVVSPNGKEIIFIHRGEVFATSVDGSMTRRITSTPEREKNLTIHPDGNAVAYASERDNSWNIYQTKLSDKEEKYFVSSSGFGEEVLVASGKETFQPAYSPDGKELAFLEERTRLKVMVLESKEVRQVHDGGSNWSYADGDQHFEWSPDGKWFVLEFYPDDYTYTEVGLVSADGKGKIVNLTKSGFSDLVPRWMSKGKMILWLTDKTGMRSYANSGGSEYDAYGIFTTVDAYDKFMMNKEEYMLMVGEDKKEDEDKKKDEDKEEKKTKKESGKGEKGKKTVEPLKIEFDGISDRTAKLTIHSSRISDARVTPDDKKLLYFSKVEKGYDLWQTDLRTKETKVLSKFGKGPGSLHLDKEGKNVFVLSDGVIKKVEIEKGTTKPVAVKGEMVLDEQAERAYLFDHIVRQVFEKFYDRDLHGVDWDSLAAEYKEFLPHINNNHDYAEMLSELLGELNASHTGARYRKKDPTGDQTASLGAFFNPEYAGTGLKIIEIIQNGPLVDAEKKIKNGIIIEKVDGQEITGEMNYYPLLNRKAGQWCLLSFYDPDSKERWTKNVKLISGEDESKLLYKRWIKANREKVRQLSGSRVGYVHIRGMADPYYRELIKEVLGEEVNREALVVDTRWNGGGDLTEDLTNFLNGDVYETLYIREKRLGYYAPNRWTKPSIVLTNEGNYSDGHCFPCAYRDLEIGKVVGMPVAGTCTAVWWEKLQNEIVFGIPVMGIEDKSGDILENKQFEPDVKVWNDYDQSAIGKDQQLERAVVEIMLELDE